MATEEKSTLTKMFANKLKTIDARTLEQTIAKAVGDLIGTELNCSIDGIDYNRVSYSRTSAKFNVYLSEPFDQDFGVPQEKSSDGGAQHCQLCEGGWRRVKMSGSPDGVMRKCTHDESVESQIPAHDLNS